MLLCKKRTTKALIRLRECAGLSAPVLFANPRDRFSRVEAHVSIGSTTFGRKPFRRNDVWSNATFGRFDYDNWSKIRRITSKFSRKLIYTEKIKIAFKSAFTSNGTA